MDARMGGAAWRRQCLRVLGAWGVGAMAWALGGRVQAQGEDLTGGDPLDSMQWPSLRRQFLGGGPLRFTDDVVVRGPLYADDPMNVPILVNARALERVGGGVARIVVLADRNPVREVLTFEPARGWALLAFRMRLEQASPVRAAVQTRDGQWHVGGTWVKAAGGGCTVPGQTRADGSWARTLNQVQGRFFLNAVEGSRRLRLRVMHPMDTGLAAGIPAFYIESLRLEDSAGDLWWRLALHEPVSENPLFMLELPSAGPREFRVLGHDNNGNRIEAEVRA